jgi:hypothetical protein
MTELRNRIEVRDGEPIVRASGRPVAEIERRLTEGEAPAAMGLEPVDLIAAIAYLALGPGDFDGPPLVQAQPKFPGLEGALRDDALARLLPDAAGPARLALAAGLLQVHDFWEASHQAAQKADDWGESRFAAYWHGIAHRREPDAGNAAYWFRRVGRHPLFEPLGAAAAGLLNDEASGLAARLAPGGRWDPLAFIDVCRSPHDEPVARRLQRLEMAMLLDQTVSAVL